MNVTFCDVTSDKTTQNETNTSKTGIVYKLL